MNGTILTLDEVSRYLKISRSSLYKIVREGGIPAVKVGRHWRFVQQDLDRWLKDKGILDSSTGGTGEDIPEGCNAASCPCPHVRAIESKKSSEAMPPTT